MKTIRFENGFSEDAKEQPASRRGSASAPAHKARTDATALCATPARASDRQRTRPRLKPVTNIAAKIDVGFGNTLFIRGQGAGLSWDKGQPLECVENSIWMWSSRQASEPVTFKLLINDQLWCRGENMTALPGTRAEVVPNF